MKKIALLSPIALLLGACACFEANSPPPTHPIVSVIGGTTPVVVPDPLYFSERYKGHDTKIIWRLAAGSGYHFPDNGIVFTNAEGEIVCGDERGEQKSVATGGDGLGVGADGLTFTCVDHYTKDGAYKYTIRIEGPSGSLRPLDPSVVNGGR